MKIKSLLIIIIFSIFQFFPLSVFAASTAPGACPSGSTCIDNPIDTDSPQQLIGKVIKAVLGISGSLALLMFVYGGFTWMLSGGNSEKVTKGKNTLVWAAIGLIVIFSSYALVNAIFTGLAGS